MPLQKLPPRDPSGNDKNAPKWQQMQNRRRTLQTISELTATDMPPPDLVSFITTRRREELSNTGKKMENSSKRQSLPHYHSSPAYACVQAGTAEPQLRPSRSLQGPGSNSFDPSRYEAGWNARRARARAQDDFLFANANDASTRTTLQDQSSYRQPAKTRRHSQSSLNSHFNQQQLLLCNSRSISGFSQANDTESSGSPSTDSSSCHDSAVRRSRSGSSSDRSWTWSHTSRPISMASPPPIPHYYTTGPASNGNYNHHSRIENTTRTSPGYRGTWHHSPDDIQRARLASLAALTAPAPAPIPPCPLQPTTLYTPTQPQHRHSHHLPHPQPYPRSSPPSPQHISQRPRPMSTPHTFNPPPHPHPYPHPPPPRQIPSAHSHAHAHAHSHAHAHAHARARAHAHRAKTAARVRRANELERERERELSRTLSVRSKYTRPRAQDHEKAIEYDAHPQRGTERVGCRTGVKWGRGREDGGGRGQGEVGDEGEEEEEEVVALKGCQGGGGGGGGGGCLAGFWRGLRLTFGRVRREARRKRRMGMGRGRSY